MTKTDFRCGICIFPLLRKDIMDKEIKRSIQLICSLLLGTREPSVVRYTPSKTCVPKIGARYFRRALPHKKGISAARLQNFLAELEANPSCNIHSVMVLKDGAVICEAYAPGYERGLVHLSHSMSKTVTGIAVAILADEEKVNTDTTVSEIFTEFNFPDGIGDITVKDLLLMSSGMSFNELGAVTSLNWTEDFFTSEQMSAHGEGFSYNSMNSYILARAVERLCGESFEDFVRSRLFAPLRITNYFWESGPEGTLKGGWGLYLSLEDWLKIASLFLSGGKFEGIQILSHVSMLNFLVDRNPASQERNPDFDYAGHLNLAKKSSAVLFNGLFGQNVYIDPVLNLAVAVNSGNNDLSKSGATLDIIMKYFSPDTDDGRIGHITAWRAARTLMKQQRRFFESRGFARSRKNFGLLYRLRIRTPSFPDEWSVLLGKYLMPMNNCELLPIIPRVMQNNLSGGIDTVEFLRKDGIPHIRFTLADTVRDIPIGIYSHEECIEDFSGEKYRIRTLGACESTEDGKIFKIEFVFPELPNTRYLTVKKLKNNAISLTFGEQPSAAVLAPMAGKITSSSAMASLAIGMIERKLGEGFIEKKVDSLFSPSFIAPSDRSAAAHEILAEENARIERERAEILSVPFIYNFIRAEIKDGDSDTDGEPKRRKGIFGIISGIFKSRQEAQTDSDAPIAEGGEAESKIQEESGAE